MSVERPQPNDFHPFTALQIYDLPPIVTYPDLTFEEILEVAAHYWHSTDAISDASFLAAKMYTPQGTDENFTIMILNHAYFTGTIEYTSHERYSEYSTMAKCFKYHENRPIPLYRTPQNHTQPPITIQHPEPTHTVRIPSGLNNPKLATTVYHSTSNFQNGVTIPRNTLATQ